MTLNDALKIPGVWWVVLRNHQYAQDDRPARVEVVEVVKTVMINHSLVKIDNKGLSRIPHTFPEWDAHDNFWLAWAAIQRSIK